MLSNCFRNKIISISHHGMTECGNVLLPYVNRIKNIILLCRLNSYTFISLISLSLLLYSLLPTVRPVHRLLISSCCSLNLSICSIQASSNTENIYYYYVFSWQNGDFRSFYLTFCVAFPPAFFSLNISTLLNYIPHYKNTIENAV